MGSSYGIANPNSSDNTPPAATITSDCFDAAVQLSDFAAGLSEIVLDSVINMSYRLDSNWIDGAGLDTSGYSMFVIDNTKSAVLEISVFDGAGNRTTVKSSYIPQTANIDPALQNFGASTTSSPAVIRYDTLVNAGQVPFNLGQLSLKYGNQGFVIDSSDIQDAIPVGGKRLIKISFSPVVLTLAVDSLIYGDQCFTRTSALLGSGSAMDFFVEDAVWQNVPLNPVPPGWTKEGAVIHNLSKTSSIHVTSAGWVDNVHFALVPGQTFPVTVPPLDTASVFYYFEPTDFTRDTSAASWSAPEVTNSNGSLVIRYNKLIGNAVAPLLTFTGDTTVNLNCLDTSVHSVLLTFYISNNGSEPAVINRVTVVGGTGPSNITGVDQHGNTWNPVANQETIPAGAVDIIEVTFPIDPQSNSSFTSQITALDASDNIIGAPLTATVNVNYSVASVSATNITFGPVSHWGTKVPGVFIIWNTGSTALTIDTMFFIEGGPYNSSFSFTTTPTLPDILPAGQTMSVNVAFDPSVSSDSEQNSVLEVFSDACNEMAVNLGASLLVSGVAETNAPSTLASVVMLDDGRSIQFVIPSDWAPPICLDIYNILGEAVFNSSFDGTSTLDLGELPHGVYFYRLHTEQTTQTGEIIIGE